MPPKLPIDAERTMLEFVAAATGYIEVYGGPVLDNNPYHDGQMNAVHPQRLAALREKLRLGGRKLAAYLRAEFRSGRGWELVHIAPDTHESQDAATVLRHAECRARMVWNELTKRERRTLDAAARELGLCRFPLLQ